MVPAIIQLVDVILDIVKIKIERKYIDQYLELKRAWYEETNKADAVRSDAVLDNLKFELRVVSEAIAADARAKNA